MNEPLTSVPTEEHELKETLRALEYAIWRMDAAFNAISNDKSELSHKCVMMLESGMEAASVSMDLINGIPLSIGIDTRCGDDGPGAFKRAYVRARAADRAIEAGGSHERSKEPS